MMRRWIPQPLLLVAAGLMLTTGWQGLADLGQPSVPTGHVVAPDDPFAAERLIADLSEDGATCSTNQVLTDEIVVAKLDGTVDVVTFDEAWDASQSGAATAVAWCVR